MENQASAFRLCSNCAGDYEDPDWTAWGEDGADEEEESAISEDN